MPIENEKILNMLKDFNVLMLAYTASSDYVMRLSFEQIKELQVFRGKTELAPAILKQYRKIIKSFRDSVILGAHLYALELTGEKDSIKSAILSTLSLKELRQDPRVTQIAVKIAAKLIGRRLPYGKDLNEKEIAEINAELTKEVK
jgi:viroplasmin and RNaseH domain-containing protein